MRVLVFGDTGQLGTAFKNEILSNIDVITIPKYNVKLTNYLAMKKKIKKIKPEVIINFLAFTDVDNCEIKQKIAKNTNTIFPMLISKISKQIGCVLIHFSTDYVFFSDRHEFISEHKKTNPKSTYGLTKRNGETWILKSGCFHLILRTSWVYSDIRKNFFNSIKNLLLKDDKIINVVSDQWGGPTLAYDLAKGLKLILGIIKRKKNKLYLKNISGIYHISNSGLTNWYNFACMIAENLGYNSNIRIKSTTTGEFNSLAVRPFNSKLNNLKLRKRFGIKLPNFQNSFSRFIYEKKYKSIF